MRTEVVDAFSGDDLDRGRWSPAYLPAWASRSENAARYRMTGSSLVLEILPEQGLWCRDTHQPPLRTSTIASGDWSGPLGSDRGPQPFRSGLRVQQEQPRYPMVMMVGVFDFPDGTEATHTPTLEVDRISGTALAAGQGRTA